MLGLVPLRLKVEVVLERVVAALANTCQDNGHVELSPTLLIDAERRLLDDCSSVSIAAFTQPIICSAHSPCLFFSKDGCRL